MIPWPRDLTAGSFTASIQTNDSINLLRSCREWFQNCGPSCMKNLSIFSIMYFSFSENMNVMVKKNCKTGSKMKLFPIILNLCCRDFIYTFFIVMTSSISPLRTEIEIWEKEYRENKKVMDVKEMGTAVELGFV